MTTNFAVCSVHDLHMATRKWHFWWYFIVPPGKCWVIPTSFPIHYNIQFYNIAWNFKELSHKPRNDKKSCGSYITWHDHQNETRKSYKHHLVLWHTCSTHWMWEHSTCPQCKQHCWCPCVLKQRSHLPCHLVCGHDLCALGDSTTAKIPSSLLHKARQNNYEELLKVILQCIYFGFLTFSSNKSRFQIKTPTKFQPFMYFYFTPTCFGPSVPSSGCLSHRIP